MRVDISVARPGERSIDYRLDGPDTTTWAEVADALTRAGHRISAPREWPLRSGAVLGGGRPEPATAGHRLHVTGGPNAGESFPLAPKRHTLGRGENCDLVLADPDVSRLHLDVDVSPREVVVVTRETPNPASVNGIAFDGARPIRPGDRLRVGSSVLELAGPDLTSNPPRVTEVAYPRDPRDGSRSSFGLWSLVVPLLAGAGTALMLGTRQLLLLAMITPIVVAASLVPARLRARGTRRRYRGELREAQSVRTAALAAEAAQRRNELPGPDRARRSISVDRPTVVRLGLGQCPARLLVRNADGTSEQPDLDDVPISIELTGAGLTLGAPLPLARAQARWILCQLAQRNPESRLAIGLLVSTAVSDEWMWARWLPHVHRLNSQSAYSSLRQWLAASPDRAVVLVLDGGELDVAFDDASVLRIGGREGSIRAEPRDDTGLRQLLTTADGTLRQFTADSITIAVAEAWARELAGRPAEFCDMPRDIGLLELLRLPSAPSAADLTRRWSSAAGQIAIPIGRSSSDTVTLDLDRDGPHALICGTTGSGKSELLRTIVLALAASCPPAAVQFLLIDYKGGAAFGPCEALPHTAGVVTDLDAAQTARALRSLSAELRRRERLLAQARAATLPDYARHGHEPSIPRLVVIVDEFAGLATELPDFVHGLVSIAQRGRSLGMHLVLATQRPGGAVSADIRANANLRIALRTLTSAESVDVIGCGDAAGLDPDIPGRAIWAGAAPLTFQAASLSAACTPDQLTLTRLGPWRDVLDATAPATAEQPAADALVAAIAAAAATSPVPATPWLPALPDVVDVVDTVPSAPGRYPFALVDLPDEQRRETSGIDLDAGGVLVFAGGRKSGKSSALRALATIAASALDAASLQLYCLDFGGSGLAALADLPHLGTRATSSDPISLSATLIARLAKLTQQRRDSPTSPALLVLIDDFGALSTALDAFDLGATTTHLRALLAAARGAGVTVALTGDRSVLGPQLSGIADERIVLRCADPSDYQLAGIAAADVPARWPPGRGVRARDGAELQCVLGPDPATISGATSPAALRLRPLPIRASASARPTRAGLICLGLGGDAAEPIWLDTSRPFQLLVAGPPRSGKSTLLDQIAAQLGESAIVVPRDDPSLAEDDSVLLIDDVEQYDTLGWAHDMRGGVNLDQTRIIVAGTSDRLMTTFRGLAGDAKRWHRGIVLQPAALDGELLGIRLGRGELGGPVGRGVALGAPEWGWPGSVDHAGRCAIQTWSP